ncbi:MAG: hypothetical protein ACTHQQ_04175 [Solirubrobacteraceae bacterium]
MRRARLAALMAVLTVLAGATSARAAGPDPTCYAGTSKAFNISVSNLVNNETTVNLTDGTPIPGGLVAQSSLNPQIPASRTTGSFVNSYTNETTGKTITRNISGPTWVTWDPTPTVTGAIATGTEVATGNNGNVFGPLSQANLNLPALTFTSGLLIIHFVVMPPMVATSFLLNGTQEDGCALLTG